MAIKGEIYTWNENNARNIPAEPGVYELLDGSKNVLYIGQSSNLRERFGAYWSIDFEGKRCKQRTKHYRREITGDYIYREKELIGEYKRLNGDLPPCNKNDPAGGG